MTTGPLIELSASALSANLQCAKKTLTNGLLMLAVKSNAYGHGDELIVPAAVQAGVDEFAVLDIDTALRIRTLAPGAPLLAWLMCPGDRFSEAAEAGIELGISAMWQLDELAALSSGTPVTIHLKIDTGLNRNGASAAEWPALVSRAAELQQSGVVRIRGIWSHLSDTSIEVSRDALARFDQAIEIAAQRGVSPEITHIAASHAAVELPEARRDLIRLGILAYGVSPFDEHSASDLGFSPVLTLAASVDHVTEDGAITLGVGCSHGLLPPVERATISIKGVDYTLTEVQPTRTMWSPVSEPADVQVGEKLPVVGAGASCGVEQWATWCHTIGDEVLAKLSPAIPRIFVS
jgi:alanine racemase